MTAGALQLNFIGPQDKHLTGNPQMTYFKSVYKKYSNFAKDTKKLSFENKVQFGSEHICVIPYDGDLLSDIYLYIELSELISSNNNENWAGYINGLGYSIIEHVEIQIGGLTIDKLDSNWLDIYNELFDQRSDTLIGKFNTDITLQENNKAQKLYIPIPFWFSKNSGSALPIIALRNHEIKIKIKLRNLNEIIKSDISTYSPNTPIITANILANYIHLDIEEQKYFTNNSHEYLIDQLQTLSDTNITTTTVTKKIPLEFAHPIKSIYWVILDDINHTQNMKTGNNWLSYTSSNSLHSDTFNSAKITINGQDKMISMDSTYYRNVLPYETQTYFARKYIYSYSFSLYPGQYQPSGSINYSRIQKGNSHLEFTFNNSNNVGGGTNGKIRIYGTNYNVLKIDKGQGGLLYMN
tara:strand:- start:2878 stop:4104 length:1227 start_codon:yes stop_codon:yes gene_type:complete